MDRHSQIESIRALADISENPYQAGERLTGRLGDYWAYHFRIGIDTGCCHPQFRGDRGSDQASKAGNKGCNAAYSLATRGWAA